MALKDVLSGEEIAELTTLSMTIDDQRQAAIDLDIAAGRCWTIRG